MTRLQRWLAVSVCTALLLAQAVQPSRTQATYTSQQHTYNAAVISVTAGASKDYLNIFNASGSGKIVYLVGIYISPANTAAVVGSSAFFTLSRTTSAGATCTAVTIRLLDSTNLAVPAQITAGTNCTTDPTVDFDIGGCASDLEETRAIMNPPPCYEYQASGGQPITLREGQGLLMKTTALAPVGLVSVRMEFIIK